MTLPKPIQAIKPYLMAFLFFVVVCLCSTSTIKGTALVCILLALIASIWGFTRLRERITLPLLVLALLIFMDGISTFYAISGKFALQEFLKILISFCLVLFLLAFAKGEGVTPGRSIASLLERCIAITGLVSIDLLSTHFISSPILSFFGLFSSDYSSLSGLESGIRMTSMFDAPNVFAGMTGIGVILSLGLVLSSDAGKERMSHIVCLFINALAFVLAFSMGATAFIVLAFLVYLILEIKERRAALFVLMAETLILTVIAAALVSMTSFDQWDGFQPIPLLCVIVGAVLLCLLDKFVGRRIADKLATHGKALLVIIVVAVVAVLGYVIAAFNMTGAITLQEGETLRRSVYPEPGEYVLNVQSNGSATVTIESQNEQDTMMHTSTVLYTGDLSEASFTVPDDSLVVYFNFKATESLTFESVIYEGEGSSGSVPLGYKMLPGFVSNRLQGLFANQNAIQRLVFFEDGIKLFKRSPIIGLGLGSYENGIMSVQSFYYETKYAHNHYIQTLAETGVIGLILFVGLLVVCAVAVLFARRKDDAHPLVPALGAALVFMAGHAATEVNFSYHAYLPIAFGVFALINLCCGNAISVPWLKKKVKTGFRWGCSAVLAVFFVLLCGNMTAANLVKNNPTFDSLVQAVQMDIYERNDYMLSYIISAPNAADYPEIQAQAAEYAERLTKVNSNTIPYYLADYYLSSGQTEQGFAMVEKYVCYVSSDRDAWNSAIAMLEFYAQDTELYRNGVTRIAQVLEDWNAANIGDITLDEGAQNFLDRMAS